MYPRNGVALTTEIVFAKINNEYHLVGPSEEGYVPFPFHVLSLEVPTLLVSFDHGYKLKVAEFHRFLTPSGWKKAKHLKPGSLVCAFSPQREEGVRIELRDLLMKKFLSQKGLFLVRISSVEEAGNDEVLVYLSEVPTLAVANGGILFQTTAYHEAQDSCHTS